ncbi:membrane cofactor protein-like isoform X14 [Trachinotus anak]|uniref:membrane cofactor protein-like isoform X14 n=1 Tax=Trachinotus anak TaxID=443729 RepID=UPI0039F20115
MGVTHFLLLGSLGLAITVQAQNCGQPVLHDTMFVKGDDILRPSFQDGAIVHLGCKEGYRSLGPTDITCTGGQWTPVRMTCEKKNCGSAGEVPNLEIDYPEGTEYGAQLKFECKPGYHAVGGSPNIFCREQGWDGRLPTCEETTCDQPPPGNNANFKPLSDEPYPYRAVITYTCLGGFVLNGSNTLTCSEDGKFHPEPPNCIKVECEEPDIKNAFQVSGARPPYGHKATVKYQCNPGFVLEGQDTLICEINSKWSTSFPTCKHRLHPTDGPKDPTENGGQGLSTGTKAVLGTLILLREAILKVCLQKMQRKYNYRNDPVCPVLLGVKTP